MPASTVNQSLANLILDTAQQFNTAETYSMTPGEFRNRFKCQRCGKCCTDLPSPGIRVYKNEMEKMARLAHMSKVAFRRRFTVKDGPHFIIKYPCPFYTEGCTIYEERPVICRYFPLQKPIVKDGKAYAVTAPNCPGVRKLVGD